MPRALARLLVVALALSASAALADSFTLRIGVAPPPPRVEVMTVAPSPGPESLSQTRPATGAGRSSARREVERRPARLGAAGVRRRDHLFPATGVEAAGTDAPLAFHGAVVVRAGGLQEPVLVRE